jgi:thioredoxin reductase
VKAKKAIIIGGGIGGLASGIACCWGNASKNR